ncbi:MAG TPA: AAA family ATPase [Pseudobdellovibrionaceae bacterium]
MSQPIPDHQSQEQNSVIKDTNISGDLTFAPVQIGTKIETLIVESSLEKITQRKLNENSPYQGLKRFNLKDRERFFGRDKLIARLFEAVNRSNLSLVLGASGSGKSSVVRAGLIPELKKSLKYQTFYDFIFTPNQDPFDSLYRCLLSEEKDYNFSKSEAEIALEAKAETLSKVISTLKKDEERWLIFVDQFEELFTICDDPDKRKNFISGLVQVAKSGNSSVKLVLAMRSDFLEQFSFYPDLGSIANQNNIHLVTEMYPDELQQAIEQPAAMHGVVFEEGLVKQIIDEVEGQKGYLPLLQYTLDLFWESECRTLDADGHPNIENRTLNKKNYTALEGVRGALQKRVNEIYKDVCERNKDGEAATKQIFLKLVNIVDSDSGSRAVNRRAYRYEFVGEPVENTLKRFVDENLLVSSYEYSNEKELLIGNNKKNLENATIEIAHEILLSSWDRLKRWLEEEKEAIILKNWLAGETRRWLEVRAKDESKANDELLKGARLDQTVEFREKNAFEKLGGLVQEENKFIDASVEWRESARSEKIHLQRRAIKWLSGGLTAALIAMGIATWQWQRSENLRLATQSEALGSTAVQQFDSGRQIEALLLAMQSGLMLKDLIQDSRSLNNHYPAVSPLFALQTILDDIRERNRLEYPGGSELVVNSQYVSRVSFSSDGKYIVRIPEHGSEEHWDLSGKLINQSVQPNHDTTSNKEPSSIEECVVPLGGDRVIRLRYLQERPLEQQLTEQLAQLTGQSEGILSIRCSPNGKYVVITGRDGTVRLLDLSTKQIAKIIGRQGGVMDIRFSPDGQNFATWGGNVLFWELPKNQMAQHMTLLNGNQGSVTAISFSQDGKYIATAGSNGTVNLWDSSGNKIRPELKIGEGIMGVKFNRDGKKIVIVTDQGTIQIWDLAGNPIQTVLEKPQNQRLNVINVSFSPDGNYIAMAMAGGGVELRKITGEQLPGRFTGHQGWIMGMNFSVDEKLLATAGDGDTIRLWKLSGEQVKEIRAHQGETMSVSLSPDGNLVASAGNDGTIRLWDLQSKEEIAKFAGHQGKVLGVSFSPDGNFLATAGTDGTIRLWTLSGEQMAQFIGYSSGLSSEATGGAFGSLGMTFSPDGRQIATAEDNGGARLWRIETLDELLYRGCEWLKDYLAAHPDAPKVCS